MKGYAGKFGKVHETMKSRRWSFGVVARKTRHVRCLSPLWCPSKEGIIAERSVCSIKVVFICFEHTTSNHERTQCGNLDMKRTTSKQASLVSGCVCAARIWLLWRHFDGIYHDVYDVFFSDAAAQEAESARHYFFALSFLDIRRKNGVMRSDNKNREEYIYLASVA